MESKVTNIYLVLHDLTTDKTFTKYFETEYEKDKFRKKLRYSKKLMVLRDSNTEGYLD